jgi:hypothetical protein
LDSAILVIVLKYVQAYNLSYFSFVLIQSRKAW